MEKKIKRTFFFAFVYLLSLIVTNTALGPKTWSYEIKEIVTTSSDPEKIKFDLEVERVSRGVYAISGDILINVDVVEGDSSYIQAKSYRSAQGDNDYKVLPYQMPNMHFFKYLNTYYKETLMSTMKDCSDLPAFETKFQPPLEKKSYKLNACQFSQDGFPNYLQEGFYKVSIIGSGEAEYQIDVIVEVTNEI